MPDNDFPAAPRLPHILATPGTVEFHVSAHTATGGSVPERGWSDQDQYADLRTLQEARTWARNTMSSDSRVDHCTIRESVKGPHGMGWTPGRHLETVHAPPSPQALSDLAAKVRSAGTKLAPAAAVPQHLRAARRHAALARKVRSTAI